MRDLFAIFACQKTKRLVVEFRKSHGVYTPMSWKKVFMKSIGEYVIKGSPAIQGIVFCPLDQAPSLRRALSHSVYYHKPFYKNGIFATVKEKDLLAVQSILMREYENRYVAGLESQSRFKIGDRVRVKELDLFRHIVGVIVRFKPNGDARVQLDHGFSHVEIHQTLLDFA